MKLIYVLSVSFLIFIGCSAKSEDYSILILSDQSNLGTYTAEILKAEGFNALTITSPGEKTPGLNYLNRFDIVILTEMQTSEQFRKLLTRYVEDGGNLIAFRPAHSLAPLFGLGDPAGTAREGYLKIDTGAVSGKGLTAETIQYHGESDLYRFCGGKSVAGLYINAKDSAGFPALVLSGSGKGRTAAFTYNLPKSIIYTRQGNPEWAGEERDKVDGPTATDLFYPKANEKQWNDPSKIEIPQADEQMRLLSHVIEEFSTYSKPLPRFWYFPDTCKSVFIFTIDGEESKESDINAEIMDVQSKGGNATLYEIGTYIKPETVAKWRSEGNEVAIHYNDVPNYANPTHENMKEVLDTMTANFRKVYGYLPVTTRNHWVVWVSRDSAGNKEFTQQALLEARYGVRFDCNYYQFGGNKVYPNWMGDVGHINGSGIPMKFVRSNGKVLNIYQSNTQLPDETWLKENIESKSRTMIDRSLDEENYAWLNANYHTWYWPECREAGLRVLEHCRNRGVPVWTAEKAYRFLEMKDQASFTDIRWLSNRLTFILKSGLEHPARLTFMLPVSFSSLKLQQIAIEGSDQPFTVQKIKGFAYALVTVKAGRSYDVSVSYN